MAGTVIVSPEFTCVHLKTSVTFPLQNHPVELCQIVDLGLCNRPVAIAKRNDESRVLRKSGNSDVEGALFRRRLRKDHPIVVYGNPFIGHARGSQRQVHHSTRHRARIGTDIAGLCLSGRRLGRFRRNWGGNWARNGFIRARRGQHDGGRIRQR